MVDSRPMKIIPFVIRWMDGIDGYDQMPWGPIDCPCAMANFLEQKEEFLRECALQAEWEVRRQDTDDFIFEQQLEELDRRIWIADDPQHFFYGQYQHVRVPLPQPVRRPPWPPWRGYPQRPRDGVLLQFNDDQRRHAARLGYRVSPY